MKNGRWKNWGLDFGAILLGTVANAVGLVVFTIPNNIAPGGVSGLATAFAHISPLSVGLWTFILNIPIVILTWYRLGFPPIAKSVLGAVLLSGFIDLFSPLFAPYTGNPLLAALAGGILFGIGTCILFLRGASTGGTDLVSLLLSKIFPNMSLGLLLLSADALVVVIAMVVFHNLEVALYSIVTIFVSSKTIDSLMQGIDHAKVIHVVSEVPEKIRAYIADEKEMGVTLLPGTGGYTRKGKTVLLVVVRRNELAQMIKAIQTIDQKAFLFVTDAVEVHGEGFKEDAASD